MRILFMGTPDFAAVTLKSLIDGGFDVIGAVSQPDRPVGRHQELKPTAVKVMALEHGLPVWQPEKIGSEEGYELMRSLAPDVCVVAAYGQILPQGILDIPKYGCLNVHGSLLPAYRGASPIQRALYDGCETTGVTVMQMDKGMDTGDMLLKREIPIEKNDTGGSLFDKLALLGGDAICDALHLLEEGKLVAEKQDASLATYAPMLKKEEGLLDFNRTAAALDCQIRALDPWPGAYTFLNGKRLKVLAVEVLQTKGKAGLLQIEKEPIVFCAEGALKLTKLQPEGKKPQSGEEFVRGLRLEGETYLG